MSTWEAGLSSLYRKTPKTDIKRTILNLMESNSDDRSAALVCAALADTALIMGIVAILRPRTIQGVDALFWKKKSPCRDFFSRIEKASDIKLIGPQTKASLNVIRQVRNAFAHAMIDITFDTPEIVAACRHIELSDDHKFFVKQEQERPNRYQFCYGCDAVFRGILGWTGNSLYFSRPRAAPAQAILP